MSRKKERLERLGICRWDYNRQECNSNQRVDNTVKCSLFKWKLVVQK